MKCTLSPQDLYELDNCETVDPFTRLGYHHAAVDKKTLGVIRVFNPAFKHVEIIHDRGTTPCDHSPGSGCFEAFFPDRLEFFPYRVRATHYDGRTWEYADPYAFSPVLSDYDLYLFGQGTHYQVWKRLGANPTRHQGYDGVHFAVWAPNARGVAVVGDFNDWHARVHLLRRIGDSGIWEIFIPDLGPGHKYKFLIHTQGGAKVEKLDPYAKETELRPRTAGIIAAPSAYAWGDGDWENGGRAAANSAHSPISIYEVHLGSWKRRGDREHGFLSYRELADELIPYVRDRGYTHVEFMPVAEHPLDESWGYQVLGYYAPTKRYGGPDDFRHLVDQCHRNGLGVILDWVPAHFPTDSHGLDYFDGTQLYAHLDPRRGSHPQWGTRIFNYGRKEVSNFLIANALYWCEEFHVDGLRVDAVASMLYLDYAREPGEWLPNPDGGNVNLDAVEFLKHLNSMVERLHPGRLMVAEESSSYPGVTHDLAANGLGFSYKWNLGWMNDFLSYLSKDPVYRKYHQNLLTFGLVYAFSERFMLVLSHDEVVHGKGSLLNKMPGDDWQKFANARLAFAYLFSHPGKKLHFMGMEIGQWREWNPGLPLDWHLLDHERHQALQRMVDDLNRLYRAQKALHELDVSWEGFQWVDFLDNESNMLSFLRKARDPSDHILCVFNFSPVPRHDYRIGVPRPGRYEEIFNSDSRLYGGSNLGNMGGRRSDPVGMHNLPHSLSLTVPPLSASFFRWRAGSA